MRKIIPYFILFFISLSLWACPEGDFGTFSPEQDKKEQKELFDFLQQQDFEVTKERADAGNGDSQNDLGLMYVFGIHTERNLNEAISWFMTAADQSHFIGMYNLGIAYLKGVGSLKRDQVEAHKWFNLTYAMAQRTNQAQSAGIIHDTIKEIEKHWYWTTRRKQSKAQKVAEEWVIEKYGGLEDLVPEGLIEQARQKHRYAPYFIARKFHYGEGGVPQNNVYAYKWYIICSSGHESCQGGKGMIKSRMIKGDMELGEQMAQEFLSTYRK